MTFGATLRIIRESEGLTRRAFADKCGLSNRTIEILELSARNPTFPKVQAICAAYPQYTLWLMLGGIEHSDNQVIPRLQLDQNK